MSRTCLLCCRLPAVAHDVAAYPVIELEAVQGRLPSAPSASSFQQQAGLLQGAQHAADAVTRVPLDRWDADWMLSEAGSRWASHPTDNPQFRLPFRCCL